MKQHEHRPIAFGEGDIELERELATDKHEQRKKTPVFSGVIKYFADAVCEVSRCSLAGNQQHHADKPLHWDRSKSTDEPDALLRHLMQYDELDDDGILHASKVAWRAMALLQKTLEARGEAPLSPYNKKS
jgi:hypothetical protein